MTNSDTETQPKVVVNPKEIEAREQTSFGTTIDDMKYCEHDLPIMIDGLMRCPKCREVAEETPEGWTY